MCAPSEEVLGETEPAAATDDDELVWPLCSGCFRARPPPVTDVDGTVRDRRRTWIVADHDHSARLLVGELADQLVDERGVRLVELTRRLVREQETRAIGERGADGDTLLLAAGERTRPHAGLVR